MMKSILSIDEAFLLGCQIYPGVYLTLESTYGKGAVYHNCNCFSWELNLIIIYTSDQWKMNMSPMGISSSGTECHQLTWAPFADVVSYVSYTHHRGPLKCGVGTESFEAHHVSNKDHSHTASGLHVGDQR